MKEFSLKRHIRFCSWDDQFKESSGFQKRNYLNSKNMGRIQWLLETSYPIVLTKSDWVGEKPLATWKFKIISWCSRYSLLNQIELKKNTKSCWKTNRCTWCSRYSLLKKNTCLCYLRQVLETNDAPHTDKNQDDSPSIPIDIGGAQKPHDEQSRFKGHFIWNGRPALKSFFQRLFSSNDQDFFFFFFWEWDK